MIKAAVTATSLVSDRNVIRFTQILAFAGAIAVFLLSCLATTRFASSAFEVFTGIVQGGILSSALVIIGMLLPSIGNRKP